MLCFYLIFSVNLIQICIGLHCRDVYNNPVDWWFIYKPAKNTGPGLEEGDRFFYITSNEFGRWQLSPIHINANNSTLDHTLALLFNTKFSSHLAAVVYNGRPMTYLTDGSSAQGLLMADEIGGLWLTYSVPDLINLNEYKFTYPSPHLDEGHVLMCMSLDLPTVNEMANVLRHISAEVVSLKIPAKMETHLPYWYSIDTSVKLLDRGIKRFNFLTRGEDLHGVILTRPSGDKRCLYRYFAKIYSTVLDVYKHSHKDNICMKNYSVRNIDKISIKHTSDEDGLPIVWYIHNTTDRFGFAVSTAAVWQRRGLVAEQYWTCLSNVEHQFDDFKAGLIVCLNDYKIWLTFDNFKTKEPVC